MHFFHKQHYGKDFFYPESSIAKKFVEAFPGSSGKRKSLTLNQMHIMKELGIDFEIKEKLKTKGEANDITGNERL